jgi:transposase
VCWSHIQRDFRRHSEGLAEQKTFGEQGLELTRRVFAAWRAYQNEHHDRDRPRPKSRRSRPNYGGYSKTPARRAFAPTGTAVREQPTQGLARALDLRHRRGRRADQQSRGACAPGTPYSSKLSHGTSGKDGERFAERAQSAAATCRLQGRSLFAYLRGLITAHNRGDPFPSFT